eukprot:SAG31_NODE_11521_length_1021_cov_1.579176_1_plen_80_part_10
MENAYGEHGQPYLLITREVQPGLWPTTRPTTSATTAASAARCPRHTFVFHHAAHLVSAVRIPTRYPPRPRVEGLDRGATR